MKAEKYFERVIQEKKAPDDIPKVFVSKNKMDIVDLLVFTKLASSKGEARRLISQKAIRIDEEVVSEIGDVSISSKGFILQRGARRFARVIFKK